MQNNNNKTNQGMNSTENCHRDNSAQNRAEQKKSTTNAKNQVRTDAQNKAHTSSTNCMGKNKNNDR